MLQLCADDASRLAADTAMSQNIVFQSQGVNITIPHAPELAPSKMLKK